MKSEKLKVKRDIIISEKLKVKREINLKDELLIFHSSLFTQKEELAMPFIIEKERDPLYKDGLEAGIEKGIEKGKKEQMIAIAKSLLDLLDDETIAKRVGLALEEVKRLRERAENGKK